MGTADYWCTWATQSATRAERRASGALAFPGDQGLPGTRDNLDENAVFGPDGWAGLFPEHRGGLLFLLDDGWDVPYGAKPAGDGIGAFGSLVPDPVRFPPRSAGASGHDRLRELARRVEDAGWKGLGVWVACQAPGERHGAPFDEAALAEDLRRKIDAAADAGVRYWKVDWGVHCRDVRYRRLMSETKERLCPELAIEHCIPSGNAFNGRPGAHGDPADPLRFTGPSGRIFGNPAYTPLERECEEILSFADAFRSYDSAHPLTTATMLERAAWELECADRVSSRAVVNTEDEPLLAAGLGLGLGMMRAPVWPAPAVARIRPRRSRMAEALRCVAWHRTAPPFGGEPVDLTARCVREAGRIVLPGEALAAVGTSRNPPGDDSEPGALVEVI